MSIFAIVGTLLRRSEFSAPLEATVPDGTEAFFTQVIDGPGVFSPGAQLGQFAELWALALSDYEAHAGAVDWKKVQGGHAQIRLEVAQVLGRSQEDRETAVVHVDNYYAGHVSYLVADAFPPSFPSFGKVGTRRIDDFLASALPFLPTPVQLRPYAVARYDASILHAGPTRCLGSHLRPPPAHPWRTRVRLSFHEPWKVATQLLPSLFSPRRTGGSQPELPDMLPSQVLWSELAVFWRLPIADGKLCSFAIGGSLRSVEVAGNLLDFPNCENSELPFSVYPQTDMQAQASLGAEFADFAKMTEPSVLAIADRKQHDAPGMLQKAEEQSQAVHGPELGATWANSSKGDTARQQPVRRDNQFSGAVLPPCTVHASEAVHDLSTSLRRAWCVFEQKAEPMLAPQHCVGITHTAGSGVNVSSSAKCHNSSQIQAAWLIPASNGRIAGMHVFGHDIVDHNLAGVDHAAEVEHCAQLCESRSDCGHWMLVPGDYTGLPAPTLLPGPAILALRGTCLLKTQDARRVEHHGLISGTRGCAADSACAEHNIEYWGGLYRDQKSPSAAVCQKLCQVNSYCAYWTYAPLDYVAPPPGQLEHVPEVITSFLRGRCFLKYPPSNLSMSFVSEFPGAVAGYGLKLTNSSAPVPKFDPVWPLARFTARSGRRTLLQGAPLYLRSHADSAQYIAFLDERLCLGLGLPVHPLHVAFLASPLGLSQLQGGLQQIRLRVLLFQQLQVVLQPGGSDLLLVRVLHRSKELTCSPSLSGSAVCIVDISTMGTLGPEHADDAGPMCVGWQVSAAFVPVTFSGPRKGRDAEDAMPVWWARGELEEGEVRILADKELRTYSMQLQYQV